MCSLQFAKSTAYFCDKHFTSTSTSGIEYTCDILPMSILAAAHHHHHHHHEGGMKSAHCSSEPRLTENDISPGIRRRGSRRGQSMHHTHQRKSNAFLDVPDVSSQMPPREEGEDEDSYRLRSFSLTSKGQK